MNRSGQVADVLGGIVFVALVAALVKEPNTAKVIEAQGQAFSQAVRAASGGLGYYPPAPPSSVREQSDVAALHPYAAPETQMRLAVDTYLSDSNAEVTDLEADLDRRLGREPRRARSHRSDYSALSGRVRRALPRFKLDEM